MEERAYYEAYDDRYRQIHAKQLQWAADAPSPIVAQVLNRYGISREAVILEIGCGEGRDARFLLDGGFDLTATDISPEAIRYCREKDAAHAEHYRVLDCLSENAAGKWKFIYAVAVIHMLVEDFHRSGFYRFFREHLTDDGIGLVCSMGDGTFEIRSDPSTAFDIQEREHWLTGQKLSVAGTSCRVVTTEAFSREISENGLDILEQGITNVEPDFPVMLYAVVKKK